MERSGLQRVCSLYYRDQDYITTLRARQADYDLLLVNGEGTMHHDGEKALQIGAAMQYAKEQRKKVCLYNTLWQDNNLLNKYLAAADRIYCREPASARQIQQAGFAAQEVPDMVFATPLPAERPALRPGHVLVLDSVLSRASRRLCSLAARRGWEVVIISRRGFDKLERKWWWKPMRFFRRMHARLIAEPAVFLEQMAEAEKIISGRFHGSCLAMLMGKPLCSVAANTHKIQGLYSAAGLDPDSVLDANRFDEESIERAWKSSVDNAGNVLRYVQHAPQRIRAMFSEIRNLA
jgi:polysaccharide pyruvyl transferase WcaK-like protein